MQNALFLAVPLVLLAGAGSPAVFEPTSQEGGITVPAESSWSVHDLVLKYAELTGASISFTEQGQDVARQTQLVLDSNLEVGPENVHVVVESLLLRYDFAVTELRARGPRMLAIDSVLRNQSNLRRKAIFVPVSKIDAFEDRPATLVQTIVHLEQLDAKVVSGSLRSILGDANYERVVTVGDGRSVILTGFGANVARVSRMLQEADRELAKQRNAKFEGK